jgi:hypothetical protein
MYTNNTFVNLATKHAGNILKTGCVMLISTVATSTLRNFTSETMNEIARDIRRTRAIIRERKEQAS